MTEDANTMALFFNCHGNLILDADTHQKIEYRNKLQKLVKIVSTRPGEVCTVDPRGMVQYKNYIQDLLAQNSEDSVFDGLIRHTTRPWKTRYLLSEEGEPEVAEDQRVGFIHKYDNNSFMEKLFEVSTVSTESTEEELIDYENQGIFLLKDYRWVSKKGMIHTLPAGFNFMKIEDLVNGGIRGSLQTMIEELEHNDDVKMQYKWLMPIYKRQPSWSVQGPFLKSIFLSDLIYFLKKKLKVENLYYIDMTCSTLEIPDGEQRPAAKKAELARTYSDTLGGGKKKTKKRILNKKKYSKKRNISTKRNICK